MVAKVNDCISEGLCNAVKNELIPSCLFNVLSTSLGDEIGLDLKLRIVSSWILLMRRFSYAETSFTHWQKSKHMLLLNDWYRMIVQGKS